MKILRISALEVPDLLNIYPQTWSGVEVVRSKFFDAGFDLTLPIESYKGINSFYYLFIQE